MKIFLGVNNDDRDPGWSSFAVGVAFSLMMIQRMLFIVKDKRSRDNWCKLSFASIGDIKAIMYTVARKINIVIR